MQKVVPVTERRSVWIWLSLSVDCVGIWQPFEGVK